MKLAVLVSLILVSVACRTPIQPTPVPPSAGAPVGVAPEEPAPAPSPEVPTPVPPTPVPPPPAPNPPRGVQWSADVDTQHPMGVPEIVPNKFEASLLEGELTFGPYRIAVVYQAAGIILARGSMSEGPTVEAREVGSYWVWSYTGVNGTAVGTMRRK